MIRLTHEEILLMHEKLIERYGGTCGLRDENLLDSALNAPFQCFGGQELYPTTIEKAVRLPVFPLSSFKRFVKQKGVQFFFRDDFFQFFIFFL